MFIFYRDTIIPSINFLQKYMFFFIYAKYFFY